MASRIIGYGGYLPQKIVSNDELSTLLDTSDDWISSRTGIKQRHIAGPSEPTSYMATIACQKAASDANVQLGGVDLVIVATTTPDHSFPSVATKIHNNLSLRANVPAFDIQAVCSGFIYALHIADSMLKTGPYKTALVVASDKMSSILDWQDRSTAVLFGDGAGAVMLQKDNSEFGIIDSEIYSDGSQYEILRTSGGVCSTGESGVVTMQGPAVFRSAIEKMSQATNNILLRNGITSEQIAYMVPHQANLRIMQQVASSLALPLEKLWSTVDKHANCSAASIPLALWDLKNQNLVQPGDYLALTSFGAGAVWGSALIRC